MFTEQDIEQIGAHGLCVADAERQLLRFREGFPYLDICRAAVAGDGILQADGAAAERYGAVYRELRPQRKFAAAKLTNCWPVSTVSLLPNGLRSLPEAAAIREPWSRIS